MNDGKIQLRVERIGSKFEGCQWKHKYWCDQPILKDKNMIEINFKIDENGEPVCDPENHDCPALSIQSTTDDSVRDMCTLSGQTTTGDEACIPALRRQRNEARRELERLRRNRNEAIEVIHDLAIEKEAVEAEVACAEAQIATLEVVRDRLAAENIEDDTIIDSLEKQLNEQRNRAEEAEAELARIEKINGLFCDHHGIIDGCGIAKAAGRAALAERERDEARQEVARLRELLVRIVTYAVEDRAWTPGTTRLARAILEAKRVLGIPDGQATPVEEE